MTKQEYIAKYGEDAWEHHLAVSREWTKNNKQKHIDATRKCHKQKPEYYKEVSDLNNIKYAELKSDWSKEHRIKTNAKYRPELKRNQQTITSRFRKYCNDAICLIENYYSALQDDFKGWDCHHRLELHQDWSLRFTRASLIKLNLYFNRPPEELIFVPVKEHVAMHAKTRKLWNEEHKGVSYGK